MSNPKVTVVIPFYNLGTYLDQAVNSVLIQTFSDWEMVIVNDGSTDHESIMRFNSYANHPDKRIKILSKENEKLPATRNHGIENSTGEYITCLDADDKLQPDYLKKCVEFLDSHPVHGFVTTWLKPFGEIEGDDAVFQIKKDNNLFLIKNVPHVSTMFRRKAWEEAGKYDEAMTDGYEDWDFWLSILEKNYDWDVIPEALFNYRVRAGSMLRSIKDKETQNYEYILNNHKSFFESHNMIDVLKSARNIIFNYDLVINRLNQENTALKNSRLMKFRNRVRDFIK